MPAKAEDLVGQQLAGYRLLEIFGRGGMSLVFLAERLAAPHERVAVKILMPSYGITPEETISFQARFLREAQTVQHLHHPHILPLMDYGEVENILYMIMPVVTGGTLARRLALRHDPLPLPEIAGYLNQLASAIDYAHQQGFLHRDIKPSNVLLDEQAGVYLVDFGIAHLFDSDLSPIDEAPTTITTTGKIYGTPTYMAPERFRGEQAEPATDIYALGILLYQLVTGQVPFKADTPIAVGIKHLNEMPPSPRSLRPDLPEPAEAAILRALAKEPAARFASASALAEAFDAGIKGQWAEGLLPPLPLRAAPLDMEETQKQGVPPVPLIPLPESPFPAHQLVLGPAGVPANNEAPVADALTQAQLVPTIPPGPPRRNGRRKPLLIGAILVAALFLILLSAFGFHYLHLSPGQEKQVLPTNAPGTPVKTRIVPTPSPRVTPTFSPQSTPTSGITPTPTPKSTPSPTPSPTPTQTPTPTPPTPTPTPTTAPQSTPTPTP